jgi:hypothetical protein
MLWGQNDAAAEHMSKLLRKRREAKKRAAETAGRLIRDYATGPIVRPRGANAKRWTSKPQARWRRVALAVARMTGKRRHSDQDAGMTSGVECRRSLSRL